MTVRVFPIGALDLSQPTSRPTGKPCPRRVWYVDTHDAPRRGGRVRHEAQDLFAPQGSEVLAPEDGEVIDVSEGKGGHCLRFYCETANGIGRTYYMAHLLERALVRVGEVVEAGALLGHVGRTGNARRLCPHLHIRAAGGRDKLVRGVWRRGGPAIRIYRELREAGLGRLPTT